MSYSEQSQMYKAKYMELKGKKTTSKEDAKIQAEYMKQDTIEYIKNLGIVTDKKSVADIKKLITVYKTEKGKELTWHEMKKIEHLETNFITFCKNMLSMSSNCKITMDTQKALFKKYMDKFAGKKVTEVITSLDAMYKEYNSGARFPNKQDFSRSDVETMLPFIRFFSWAYPKEL